MATEEQMKALQEGRERAQANIKTPSFRSILNQPLLKCPNEGMALAELRVERDGRTLVYQADLKACSKAHPEWSRERVRKEVLKTDYDYTGVRNERAKVWLAFSMDLAQKHIELQRRRQKLWAQKRAEEERAKRLVEENERLAREMEQRRLAMQEEEDRLALERELLAEEEARWREEQEERRMEEEANKPVIVPFTVEHVAEEPEPPRVDHSEFIAVFNSLPRAAPVEKQMDWVCGHHVLALSGQLEGDEELPKLSADDIRDAPSRKSVTQLQYAINNGKAFWSAIMSEDKKQGGKTAVAIDDGGMASDEEMEMLINSQDG